MKLIVFVATFLIFGSAYAQVDVEQTAGILKPVLEVAFGFLPESVIAILVLIGGFRVMFKPIMALLEAIAIYTPNKKDDKLYKDVVEGNTYKTIRFIFDYIASIKLPTKKK